MSKEEIISGLLFIYGELAVHSDSNSHYFSDTYDDQWELKEEEIDTDNAGV